MQETILEIKNLRKEYKDVVALQGLDLTIQRGQVFGLLGPNGSGKTTTLAILLGVLHAKSGSFSWFNNGSADENRKNIGALLETPNFYPYLNAIDNLTVVAKIKGMEEYAPAIEKVLKRVNLWERRNSSFRTFSLGMKQRLAIASALLNDPEVLVLDEPTNGLDPEGIMEIRDLIQEISKEGKTILIASHILDELEKVCTHAAILRKGELLQIGELSEIMAQEQMLLLKTDNLDVLQALLQGMPQVKVKEIQGEELLIAIDEHFNAAQLNQQLASRGIFLSGIREYRKNLESTFLDIIRS
jgi:ABC-type multidrug transport system ATPase subunit